MKIVILLLATTVSFVSCAANASWEIVSVSNGRVGDLPIHLYSFFGYVDSDGGGGLIECPLWGFEGAEGFYLKQYNNKETPAPRENNVMVLAYYGELLNRETFDAAAKIPLTFYSDYEMTGGILVENPSDFYLGFMSTGGNAYDGVDRFGWFHVSLDDSLRMTLLDSGIGLYGEDVIVGVGPTPEPTSGLLLLVGLAALGLRRSSRMVIYIRPPFP